MNAGPSRAGYHKVATFMACPQRYAYAHVLGLQPARESEAIATGSLLHIARMHYYARIAGRSGAIDPVEAMRTAPARIAWCFERAAMAWPRYVEWAREADDFIVLDIEREYAVKVVGSLLTARIDLVYMRDGRVWADDLKTTGGDPARVERIYEASGQVAVIWLIGARVLGELYAAVAPAGWAGVTLTGLTTAVANGSACWRGVVRPELGWIDRVAVAIGRAWREVAVLETRDPWDWPVNAESCHSERWGPCRWLVLCRHGKAAIGEYVQAQDKATMIAEGSGR